MQKRTKITQRVAIDEYEAQRQALDLLGEHWQPPTKLWLEGVKVSNLAPEKFRESTGGAVVYFSNNKLIKNNL